MNQFYKAQIKKFIYFKSIIFMNWFAENSNKQKKIKLMKKNLQILKRKGKIVKNYFNFRQNNIIIFMIHKNSHKTTTDKGSFKPNVYHVDPQPNNRILFHYGSVQTMPSVIKETKQYKQTRQNNTMKNSHILRYASEEELKRFNSEQSIGYTQKIFVPEQQCQKRIKISTTHKEQYKSSIGSNGSRGSAENKNSKLISNLKQTSSTTSAETMYTPKKSKPAFLKCKSKAMLNKKIPDTRLDREGFRILKKLGEGKFGKVYMAKQLTTGFMLAMKVVQKKKIISEGLLDQFIKQLKIQAFLKHPNIIELYGYFEDDKYFYTLMQLGCDGQLYNLICQKKKLTQETTSFITKNLLQAVDCMHKLKILHRDIKPENIVRIMGNVKICDFGWAANKMTKQQLRSTYCGTPLYLSPQILKGQKYDQKVDLWAIGILAYELLMGKSPFDICEQQDLYKIMTQQVHFPMQRKTSKQFQQFIHHILNKNPKERLNSSELLQLKFIKKYQAFQTCQQLCQ